MIRLVIDSAGDIPDGWKEKYDIQMIPINIHFGEKTYLQGVNLTNEGFYQLIDEGGIMPKSSQPSPHQFVEFYKKIADPGDTILSIHITSKLSGTFASAEMAAKELEGEYNVIPYDSTAGSVAQAMMCKEAREMEADGASIEEILTRIDFIRDNIQIILTLENLDYARMSGRVKALQAALASLLNVKAIVVLENGVLDMAEKVRTRRKSVETVIEMMKSRLGDKPVNLAIVHARDEKSGKQLFETANGSFKVNEIVLSELSISLAVNLGPGTVGLIGYPDK